MAQIMQHRVRELTADQARAWIREAGASLSFQAACKARISADDDGGAV